MGEPDPDRILDRLSASDLDEWKAASRLDPFPDQRIEFMLAQLCSMVHNALKGENTATKKPADFVPDYELTREQIEKKKAERQKKKMEMIKLRRELTRDDG